jgi:cullin 2
MMSEQIFLSVVTQFPSVNRVIISLLSFSTSSDVYSICVAYPDPLADRLYSETKLFLENHVKSQLEEFGVYMMEVNDSDNSQNQLLHNYYRAWKNYSQGLEYLNYLYL